jgi:ABC-2 type transport system permease protein
VSRNLALLRFSLGELLAGRRLPIIAGLVALPLWLPPLLVHGSGQDPTVFSLDLFRNLVVPVLLPVVSLTFSTAALGTELRRGTITNLLLKPIRRWSVLGAEYLAAVLATLLVLLPAVLVAHLLAARGAGSGVLLEGVLVATVVGALAYCALGLMLSLLVARALLVGLVYALLWEGGVVGVAPSASSLSVRGYVQGVLGAILERGGGPQLNARLGPLSATLLALVVTIAALILARRRLARMDLP